MDNNKTVSVFSDRSYTSFEIKEDGSVEIKNHWTSALYSIIDFLKELDKWIACDSNVILVAACYEQYQGSYNVVVDIKEQRKKIIEYAINNYKTFAAKYSK